MDRFIASGSDHFQILLDRQMKANGSMVGNVGRILFQLSTEEDLEVIIDRQLQKEVAKDLFRLAYKKRWLTGPPLWHSISSDLICKVELSNIADDELYNSLPLPEFTPTQGQLFKAFLIKHKDASYFMLAWHHVLFDARGAEHFSRFLCGETLELSHEDCFTENHRKPILEALEDAKATKEFLLGDRGLPVNSLAIRKNAKRSKVNYEFTLFSEEQTTQIMKSAATHVRLAKSPYFLACCTQSVYQVMVEQNKFDQESKQNKFDSFLIPVPQDQRLRGSVKPVFGNTLSYLFFRIKPSQLTDLKTTADAITSQMMDQIRKKIPHKYSSMLNLFSRLPLWLNNKIISGPTKGVIASFFFSDTGDSFNNINSDSIVKILDVAHLPPPNKYPGLTLVFSLFQKKLKVCICSTDEVMTPAEKEDFTNSLKRLLLYGNA